MKKTIYAVALVVVFAVAMNLLFAQEKGKTTESKKGEEMMGGMMGKGMMSGMMQGGMMGMCPMHKMMARMMTQQSIVATGDGGVIVMVGNKLYKFDKDLNLVKEAEVKVDTEGMGKKMMKEIEKCPMCQKMMKSGMMSGGGEKTEEKTESKETGSHESHH